MNTEPSTTITLRDDLVLKISSLLLDPVGSTRSVQVELTRFPLDADLVAQDVTASIRLTRLNSSVLAQGTAAGVVELECVRCLNRFEQPFTAKFAEQYRQTGDALEGRGSTQDDFDDEVDTELAFEINDAHELDMTELLRQWIVLSLPMTPVCGPDCPGPQQIDNGDDDAVDDRFAALKDLLDTEEP